MNTPPDRVRVSAPGAWRPTCRAAATLALAVAAGCGGRGTAEEPGGREVAGFGAERLVLPDRLERVVPASASAVDYVEALVDLERIAAVPKTAFVYADATADRARWEGKPTFTRYVGEALLAFDPDLVVTHSWQSPDTTELLRRQGVPVVIVPDVTSFDDVLETVRVLARILDAEERGEELLRDLERRRAALLGRTDSAPPAVLSYTNFGSGGWSAGSGTTVDVVIRLAGLRNAGVEAGLAGHESVDIERLLAIDPDWILVNAEDSESALSPSARFLRQEPALAGLRAVAEDRIVSMPGPLFSTGSYRLVEAAEFLAAEIERLESGR